MKLNLTPMNMTTKQAHEYLCLRLSSPQVTDKIGNNLCQKIIKKLTKEYKAERKAGLHSSYTMTPIQKEALTYLEGLEGVTPSWMTA